jgi:hypothetical protein
MPKSRAPAYGVGTTTAWEHRWVVAGYGGSYQATVLDDVDPMGRHRLAVLVPEVFGDVPVWAAASLPVDGERSMPAVGEVVSVSFEHGDSDYPVWEHTALTEERAAATSGYLGKYRGVVTDNDDPLCQRRLQVSVPEVDPSPAWAIAADGAAEDTEVPALGSGVWIEYDGGDPARPRWTGLA